MTTAGEARRLADPGVTAYETLAPYYDQYTCDDDYERWSGYLRDLITAWCPQARQILDVGCGTGRSTHSLQGCGFEVTGCDISEPMLKQARLKHPATVFFKADMRGLPRGAGNYDVVNCMDDALNFLLNEDDLLAAFQSAARCLKPGGLYIADCNTLHTYRTWYAQDAVVERGDVVFAWQGLTSPKLAPGGRAAACLRVFAPIHGRATWSGHLSPHIQRHHPPERVAVLLETAGLELVATAGLRGGAMLPTSDDARDVKTIYVARKP